MTGQEVGGGDVRVEIIGVRMSQVEMSWGKSSRGGMVCGGWQVFGVFREGKGAWRQWRKYSLVQVGCGRLGLGLGFYFQRKGDDWFFYFKKLVWNYGYVQSFRQVCFFGDCRWAGGEAGSLGRRFCWFIVSGYGGLDFGGWGLVFRWGCFILIGFEWRVGRGLGLRFSIFIFSFLF